MKIIIVGGVAGGASAATRLRRLSEACDIVLLERGPHVSFANCGLPYYLGGDISKREDILVQTPESLHQRFNIDVRVLQEVILIDPQKQTVTIHNHQTGQDYTETYDHLILSPGAAPLKPPIEGINLPGHFTLRNVTDMDAIDQWIREKKPKNVVVGGGGYIGLEIAEQLSHRGLQVALVEGGRHVMGPLDSEMASYLHQTLEQHGVDLHCSAMISKFTPSPDKTQALASLVTLSTNETLPADLVVLGLGVRAESQLARAAGLNLGVSGGIQVNDFLQSSMKNIWAIGDAIEVKNPISQELGSIALAGPANRQGRLVADNIMGRKRSYAGTYGTAILRLFDLAVGMTGLTEKQCRKANIPCEAIHLHPYAHASYYPNAQQMAMKVMMNPENGHVLGAQIVGKEGVDKRIDILSTALQAKMTVFDLADLELAYAPPYGSAKDPINMAGMIGSNIMNGDVEQIQWHELAQYSEADYLLLDVRSSDETAEGIIPHALQIPLHALRKELSQIPKDRLVITYCASGQRSYYAARILSQHGYQVKNLSGAYLTWKKAQKAVKATLKQPKGKDNSALQAS